MSDRSLVHGLECPGCGETAFFKDAEGFLCDENGKRVHDGDPACCGCKGINLSADEDGADVSGEW